MTILKSDLQHLYSKAYRKEETFSIRMLKYYCFKLICVPGIMEMCFKKLSEARQ